MTIIPSEYQKLVRDLVPEKISENGETPVTRILETEEYQTELYKKLTEEVNEFIEADNLEEIADILEVIHAILKLKGVSIEEVEKVRSEKVRTRGAFEQRIYLESVE